MDSLTKTEYAGMLACLDPAQAVNILNDRVKRIGKVNQEIADWLQERRKVEDAYVLGLKKLANKRIPENTGELGVLTTTWDKVVASVETVAKSHHTLAKRIETDVESRLRAFTAHDKDMHAMTTMQGNLGAMGKAVQEAQNKSDKLGKKGGKANTQKVDLALKQLESANDNWNTEAPHIFENLQLVDEKRVNMLRDVLTEYQTFEMEQVNATRTAVEDVLAHVLDVEATTEVLNFVHQTTSGKQRRPEPSGGRPSLTSRDTSNLAPPPSSGGGDDASQHSDTRNGGPGAASAFKRIGTVIGRRRQSVHGGFNRAPSPSKGFGSFGRSSNSGEGKMSPSPQQSSSNLRETAASQNRLSSLAESPASPETGRAQTSQGFSGTNGDFHPESGHSNGTANGTMSRDLSDLSDVQPPPGPPPSHMKDSQTDSEGYSVPAPMLDPISQAQQDAAFNEHEQPQFKLDIKNEPIREEDSDAAAALSNVTNTLRASHLVTPSRKAGTVRGRRDVRNTMYFPTGEQTPDFTIRPDQPSPASPTMASAPRAATLQSENHGTSDAQSIRSAHSMSTGPAVIKHPEMHGPGLNASIVETVSCHFEGDVPKTASAIGEVAVVYNSSGESSAIETETIRLDNFPALEAIAPNRNLIEESSSGVPGEYNVNPSNFAKTSVAFKYKVHIDESNITSHIPILLKTAWKPQGDKLGLVIEYSINPAFAAQGSLSISNLVLLANYEGGRASSCQTKPSGTHVKERALVYWRIGDVVLTNSWQRIIARLTGSDGQELRPGHIEAKWEVPGTPGTPLGSGLGLSRLEMTKGKEKEEDPFADGDTETSDEPNSWATVPTVAKLISGKFEAR